MNFLFNITGANTPFIKEYDIASATAITAGELVGIDDNLVVKANSGDYILGVAAEDHPGTADILNPRANGTKIRVNVTYGAVYSVPSPKYTAAASSATTIVTTSAGLSTSIAGACAVLVYKTPTSTNTDKIGAKRRISACAISGATATLTVASGGTACAGDIYALIPDVGTEMYLDTAGTGVAFYNSASTVKLISVCSDCDAAFIGVKLKTTFAG
ncbi:MAG: hypothetical protein K6D98_05235 [Clostridiales bacterium]|nr:hypothetical protein [Clostridia bacterium]MCR5353692.1 hypothetical protein [Clostridiales bacterium]